MSVTRTIKPGDAGAVKLKQLFGERLVNVRYRKESGRRLHTVELVYEQGSPVPDLPPLPAARDGHIPALWCESESYDAKALNPTWSAAFGSDRALDMEFWARTRAKRRGVQAWLLVEVWRRVHNMHGGGLSLLAVSRYTEHLVCCHGVQVAA